MSLENPNIVDKFKNWWLSLSPRHQTDVIAIGLLIVLLIAGLIFWTFSGGSVKKEGELQANVGVANGANAIVSNLVTNQIEVVRNAEINSNQASNALNAAINRPANQYSSNGSVVNDRYCRDFPQECR